MHIFVLVGKSGTGKSELQKRSRLIIPQQNTTRKPRPNESGYLFLSKDEFFNMVEDDAVILPNYIYGSWYGISKKDIVSKISCVVLDAVGLRQCQEMFGFENVTGIMIDVPQTILNMRMHKRGSSKEEIQKRLSLDSNKFKNIYHVCDYKITNDMDIEDAVFELHSIIREVLEKKGE